MAIKKTFLLTVAAGLILALVSSAYGYSFRTTDSGVPLHWRKGSFPLSYHIAAKDKDVSAAEVSAISRAFDSWGGIGNNKIAFRYRGKVDIPDARQDKRNTIGKVEQSWTYGPETIAYTTVWSEQLTGRIIETDIELNAVDYRWSTSGETGMMDIQNVTTHEVGHILGLGHSLVSTEPAMFPIISINETRKQILDRDDRQAAGLLYPLGATKLDIFDIGVTAAMEGELYIRRLPFDCAEIPEGERIFRVKAIDFKGDGIEELEIIGAADPGETLYIARAPSVAPQPPARELLITDTDILSRRRVVGIAAVQIDRLEDGRIPEDIDLDEFFSEEIALLETDEDGAYRLNIYRMDISGQKVGEPVVTASLWDDLHRNVVAFFSIDMDQDGRKELAAVFFDEEARYHISIFPAPEISETEEDYLPDEVLMSFDKTFDNSDNVILDIDSIDLMDDETRNERNQEMVALVKNKDGYYLNIYNFGVMDIIPDELYTYVNLVYSNRLDTDRNRIPLRIAAVRPNNEDKDKIAIVFENATP